MCVRGGGGWGITTYATRCSLNTSRFKWEEEQWRQSHALAGRNEGQDHQGDNVWLPYSPNPELRSLSILHSPISQFIWLTFAIEGFRATCRARLGLDPDPDPLVRAPVQQAAWLFAPIPKKNLPT